jgi:hypothetical protein
MNFPVLPHSLTDAERNFIAEMDHGVAWQQHRAALDEVIRRNGVIDFATQGTWFPHEVITLATMHVEAGHEREYAACVGILLQNGDLVATERLDAIVRQLPAELQDCLRSLCNGSAR